MIRKKEGPRPRTKGGVEYGPLPATAAERFVPIGQHMIEEMRYRRNVELSPWLSEVASVTWTGRALYQLRGFFERSACVADRYETAAHPHPDFPSFVAMWLFDESEAKRIMQAVPPDDEQLIAQVYQRLVTRFGKLDGHPHMSAARSYWDGKGKAQLRS